MTTPEAIQILLPLVPEEAILIATTGYISRDVCALRDRPQNFYMIGSMGLAPAIGLGIALAYPKKKVIVFDGDGALLMGLGILPMVGSLKPTNFFHVVFDNECYESTGNQKTYSDRISLEEVAKFSGYPSVKKLTSFSLPEKSSETFFSWTGPFFLLIKCSPTPVSVPASARIPYSPEEITQRVHQLFCKNGESD